METNTQIQTVDNSQEVLDTSGASAKLNAMMEFVKANLKNGIDYMSIGGGKPTLLKSGAEKMNILVGFSAEYQKKESVMKEDYYFVEILCILKNKQGVKVAECLASCNSNEQNQVKTRDKTGVTIYSQLNTILKMAEKRAYVGATLNANALSQFYTQDLEDQEIIIEPGKKHETYPITYNCESCKAIITEKVAKFSADKYAKMLCYKCQGNAKPFNGE